MVQKRGFRLRVLMDISSTSDLRSDITSIKLSSDGKRVIISCSPDVRTSIGTCMCFVAS